MYKLLIFRIWEYHFSVFRHFRAKNCHLGLNRTLVLIDHPHVDLFLSMVLHLSVEYWVQVMMYAGGFAKIGCTSDLLLHLHDRRNRFGITSVILVNEEAPIIPMSFFIKTQNLHFGIVCPHKRTAWILVETMNHGREGNLGFGTPEMCCLRFLVSTYIELWFSMVIPLSVNNLGVIDLKFFLHQASYRREQLFWWSYRRLIWVRHLGNPEILDVVFPAHLRGDTSDISILILDLFQVSIHLNWLFLIECNRGLLGCGVFICNRLRRIIRGHYHNLNRREELRKLIEACNLLVLPISTPVLVLRIGFLWHSLSGLVLILRFLVPWDLFWERFLQDLLLSKTLIINRSIDRVFHDLVIEVVTWG